MAEASGRGDISSDEGISEDEASYLLHFDLPDNEQTWLYCPPGEDPNAVVDLDKLLTPRPTIPPSSASEGGSAPKKGQEIDSRTFTRPKRHSVSGHGKKADEKKTPQFTPHVSAPVGAFKKPVTTDQTDYSEVNKENLINMSPNLQKKYKSRLSEVPDATLLENVSFPHAFFSDLSLNETITTKLSDNTSTDEEQTREVLHFKPGSVSTPRRTLQQINEKPDVDTKEKDRTFDVITQLDETYSFSTSGTIKELTKDIDQSTQSSDNANLTITIGKLTSDSEEEEVYTTFSLPSKTDWAPLTDESSYNLIPFLGRKTHTGTGQMRKSVSCDSITSKKGDSLDTPKKHDSVSNLTSHPTPAKEEWEFKHPKPVLKPKLITPSPLLSGDQELKRQRTTLKSRLVPPSSVFLDPVEPRILKTLIRPKLDPPSLAHQGAVCMLNKDSVSMSTIDISPSFEKRPVCMLNKDSLSMSTVDVSPSFETRPVCMLNKDSISMSTVDISPSFESQRKFIKMRKSVSHDSILSEEPVKFDTPKKHESEYNLPSTSALHREFKLKSPGTPLKTKLPLLTKLPREDRDGKCQKSAFAPRFVAPSPCVLTPVEFRSSRPQSKNKFSLASSGLQEAPVEFRSSRPQSKNKFSLASSGLQEAPVEFRSSRPQSKNQFSLASSGLQEAPVEFRSSRPQSKNQFSLASSGLQEAPVEFRSSRPQSKNQFSLASSGLQEAPVEFRSSRPQSKNQFSLASSGLQEAPVEFRSSRPQSKNQFSLASSGLQEGARALQKPHFSLKKLDIGSKITETYVAEEKPQEQPKEPKPSGLKPPSSSSRISRGSGKTKIPKFRPPTSDR